MSGQIAQELQNNPQAMQRIAPLVQLALSQVQQQPMRQPMPQQMQQPMQAMNMTNMGYNPFMAIQQMQRQPVQAQNPFFGGAIPFDFGLPQVNQLPMNYVSPLAAFRPGDFAAFQEAKNQKQFNNRGRNNTQYFSDSNGGYDFDGINYGYEMGYDYSDDGIGSDTGPSNASAADMGGEDV